jgi:hypothetical protein
LPRFASCKKVNTIDISLIIIADADAMRKQKYKKNRTVFAEQLGAYSSKRRVDRRYVLIVGPRGRIGQRRGDWLVAPAPAPSRGEPRHRGVVGNQHGRWIRTGI